jgi:hypothetical protein
MYIYIYVCIGSALNPAALYALWYVSGQNAETFQAEHLVGPILGIYICIYLYVYIFFHIKMFTYAY